MTAATMPRVLAILSITAALAGCASGGATAGPSPSASASTSRAALPTTVVVTQTLVTTTTVTALTTSTSTTVSAATAPPSSTSVSVSVSVAPTSATPHFTPTPLAAGLSAGQADTVVLDFLGAVVKDPSGKAGVPYLSSRLQGQIQSGRPISTVLDVQGKIAQYHADAAIPRGGGRAATVRVTLTTAAGSVQRLVTLIPEGGSWRIDDIADSAG